MVLFNVDTGLFLFCMTVAITDLSLTLNKRMFELQSADGTKSQSSRPNEVELVNEIRSNRMNTFVIRH